MIPRDRAFRLLDEQGHALSVEPIRSRSEGRYYAIWADRIPAMGYKTYEVVLDEGRAAEPEAFEPADHAVENDFYRLEFDPATGGIRSLVDKELGLELVVDDMDFDSALSAVQTGKSDIVAAGVTVTPERQNTMCFTDSYANGVQVVIVKEGSDIKSIDDLEGKQIGTQRGTTGYSYCIDDYGEDSVVPFDDGATAVQNLLAGKVDCVVIDKAPAQEYVKANAGLTILDTEYANEDYAIGMAKDNTALQEALNKALAELKADGTIQSIIDKYISAK